jgi:hypothetical protein
VGIKLIKAAEFAVQKLEKFLTNQAAGRMNIGLPVKIVIPVVVGSSPISHPI